MSLDLSILPTPQRQLWPSLGQVPPHFTLYGGTAIALRLGHRQSVDFDFFTARNFTADELRREIPFLQGAETIQQTKNTLTVLVRPDIAEKSEPVKVSFFGGLNLKRVGTDEIADNGIKVASILDLLGMKCATLPGRTEAKDYLDIDAITTKTDLSLADGLAAAHAIYGDQYNPVLTLKSLGYFHGGDVEQLPLEVKERLLQRIDSIQHDLPKVRPVGILGDTQNRGLER